MEIVSWVFCFLIFSLWVSLWLYFLVVGGLPEFGSAQKWWGGCGHRYQGVVFLTIPYFCCFCCNVNL
jgi:hypothetical protein